MYSFLTAPFYIFPLYWSMRKGVFNPSTIFFIYSFLGCWLLGFLSEFTSIGPAIIVAPWLINFDNIPWILMGLVNFLIFISYIVFKKRKTNTYIHNHYELLIPRNRKINFYVVLVLFSVVLEFSLALYLYQGMENWLRASYARIVIEDSKINFLFPLVLTINVFICVVYALLISKPRTVKTNLLFLTTVSIQLIYLVLSGGRSMIFLLVISLISIRFKNISLFNYIRIVVVGLTFVIASGYIISERYKAQNAVAQFEVNTHSIIQAAYTGLPFIDHIALSQIYIDRNGHDYGKTYLSVLTSFIPRSIWPEKPIQLSRKMRNEFYGDIDGGIPPGLFGEALISFGYFGMVAIAMLFGRALAGIENYSARCPNENIRRLRIAVLSALIGLILVRGGIDIGIYRVGIVIIAYLIFEKIMVNFRKINRNAIMV